MRSEGITLTPVETTRNAWSGAVGRLVLEHGNSFSEIKSEIERIKGEVALGNLPEDCKKPRSSKEQLSNEERQLEIEKKNNEALGRWVLDWKPEKGSEQEFHEELIRRRHATRLYNNFGEIVPGKGYTDESEKDRFLMAKYSRLIPQGINDNISAIDQTPQTPTIEDFGVKGNNAVGDAASVGWVPPADPYLAAVHAEVETTTPLISADVDPIIQALRSHPQTLAGNAAFIDAYGRLVQLKNQKRAAEMAAPREHIMLTSKIAMDEFNGLPNLHEKRRWVREKMDLVFKAGPGALSGNFEPYQYLTLAAPAIKEADGNGCWAEWQHCLAWMQYGEAAKGAGDCKDCLEPSKGISAESFKVAFGIKVHREIDGAEINGVAEAFRIYEAHQVEIQRRLPDNNASFMTAVAWVMEGYSWAQAWAWTSLDPATPGYRLPTNFWAAQIAQDMWFGTLRGIVPVLDPTQNGPDPTSPYPQLRYKTVVNQTVYPFARLKELRNGDKTVVLAFQNKKPGEVGGELNQYLDPHLKDFWQYLGETKLKDDGTLTGDATSINWFNAGLYEQIPGAPPGHYRVKSCLKDVRFENMEFSKNLDVSTGQIEGTVKGIMPRWVKYASDCDALRSSVEPGGVLQQPTMDGFAELVNKTGLWKNLDPRPEREAAYCQFADAIIQYWQKRSNTFPRSLAERDLSKPRYANIERKDQLIRHLGKLLLPPFDIPRDCPAFLGLLENYKEWGIKPKDFLPRSTSNPFA